MGQHRRRAPIQVACVAAGVMAVALIGWMPGVVFADQDTPTPEEYIAHVGGDAKFVAAGELKLDNRRVTCGRRPTVLDDKLDDYGAAYPGFLILNTRLLAKVSTPVKLWIFAHECGHQFRGPDEDTADCFAVQRGRREGWLTPEGLQEVCNFISPAKSSSMHYAGKERCESMRRCYTQTEVR
ncbi:MAG: hypothetical protein ACOYLQ_09125 [Hyphomicrobiaceae bacterium]